MAVGVGARQGGAAVAFARQAVPGWGLAGAVCVYAPVACLTHPRNPSNLSFRIITSLFDALSHTTAKILLKMFISFRGKC